MLMVCRASLKERAESGARLGCITYQQQCMWFSSISLSFPSLSLSVGQDGHMCGQLSAARCWSEYKSAASVIWYLR